MILDLLDMLGLQHCVMSNLFERPSSSLFEEEEGTDCDDSIKKPPKQECSPSHVLDHVRCGQGKDEVEQPLCRNTNGNTGLANTCWEDSVVRISIKPLYTIDSNIL